MADRAGGGDIGRLHPLRRAARLERLNTLQADHELDQKLAAERLRALHGLARYLEAIEYFLEFRAQLDRLAGLPPSPELDRLHLRSLNPPQHDDPLDLRSPDLSIPATSDEESLRPPRQLPHGIWSFTGREDLLAELDTALRDLDDGSSAGVITLEGIPGVGKTTLAIHWARRLRHLFPDGDIYIDLNGFATGSRMTHAEVITDLLCTLGVQIDRIPTPEGRKRRLQSILADRRMLVMLDNAANSEHVLPLLSLLSNCLVLITSRRHLSSLAVLHGARTLTVSPLSYEQAIPLLSKLIGPRAEHEPTAFRTLVRSCAGLPLALQLVGQHVAARPEGRLLDFAAQLRHEHTLLKIGSDGDDPSATLNASFSSSYRSLSDQPRRLFRLLGLYPGPDISSDAAAALAGQSSYDTHELLSRLVGAHLIEQSAADRYRLHDLLREYAADRASEDETPELRRAALTRLASWCLHSAYNASRAAVPYRLGLPMIPVVADVVPLEFADDRAALHWCVRERANLAAVTRQAQQEGLHDHAWRLPNAFANVFQRYGLYEEIRDSLSTGLWSARNTGDRNAEAGTLNNLGMVYLQRLGDYEVASQYFRMSRDIFQELGEKFGLTAAVHNIAACEVMQGNFHAGIELYKHALSLAQENNMPVEQAITLRRMGWAYRRQENYDGAAALYHEALYLSKKIHAVHVEAAVLAELGEIYYQQGNESAAAGMCRESLILHQRTFDRASAGLACRVLAEIHRRRNDYFEAREYARQANRLCQYTGDLAEQARALGTLANVLHVLGHLEAETDARAQAREILRDLGEPRADKLQAELTEPPAAKPV